MLPADFTTFVFVAVGVERISTETLLFGCGIIVVQPRFINCYYYFQKPITFGLLSFFQFLTHSHLIQLLFWCKKAQKSNGNTHGAFELFSQYGLHAAVRYDQVLFQLRQCNETIREKKCTSRVRNYLSNLPLRDASSKLSLLFFSCLYH